MPKSIHFYRDLLGFTVTGKSKQKTVNEDDVVWVIIDLRNTTSC